MNFLLLFLFTFLGFSQSEVTLTPNTSDYVIECNTVNIEVLYEDGTSYVYEFDRASAKSMTLPGELSGDIVACTYRLPDDSCSCTGPTCAAARRCFFGPGGCAEEPETSNPGRN